MPASPRIVVIDDSEVDLFILKHWLIKECPGCSLIEFTEPSRAYFWLEHFDDSGNLPDLIVVDVIMPVYDGFKLAEKIGSIPAMAGVPIVIVTSHSTDSEIQRARRVGAAGIIEKPFDSGSIPRMLKFIKAQ